MGETHGEDAADEHGVDEHEEKCPADESAPPAISDPFQIEEESHANCHPELAKVKPKAGECAGSKVEEVCVEVVALVWDIPETGEAVGEEEDNPGLAFDSQNNISKLLEEAGLPWNHHAGAIIADDFRRA